MEMTVASQATTISSGGGLTDRYAAALDIAEWADNLGIAASIAVS